jgi:hypothetical protein
MKNSLTIALGTIVGVLALCALTTLCLVGAVILSGPHGTPTPIGIVSPLEPPLQGTSVPTHGTPTSTASVLVLGQSVLYNNVRVSINQYEFSGAYGTRSFLEEKPKSGFKFLWVYVSARNEGNSPGWRSIGGCGITIFCDLWRPAIQRRLSHLRAVGLSALRSGQCATRNQAGGMDPFFGA